MTSPQEPDPQAEPAAERATFIEETMERFRKCVEELSVAVPEFEGCAIAFVWSEPLAPPSIPFATVLGRNTENPVFIMRACESTARMGQTLTTQYLRQLQAGHAAMVELNGQIGALQEEKAGLTAQTVEPPRGS